MKSLASIQKGRETRVLCALPQLWLPAMGGENHFCKGAGTHVRGYWRVLTTPARSSSVKKPLGYPPYDADMFLISPVPLR